MLAMFLTVQVTVKRAGAFVKVEKVVKVSLQPVLQAKGRKKVHSTSREKQVTSQ